MPEPLNVIIYCRVSQADARSPDRARSTSEQELELRRWADTEGWTVAAVYVDDGRSASRYARPGAGRAAWSDVQAHIAGGTVDALLTWESSRATRRMEDYAELRELCARHSVRWGYAGTLHDMADASDRFRTGLDALLSESETDKTSARIRRSVALAAEGGRPHGRIPYGWKRNYHPDTGALIGQEPHPAEAPIVAEIVERVAKGDALYGISRDLNLRNVPPPRSVKSGQWAAFNVRRIARNLHHAGIRVHKGTEHPGTWEPIVDVELVRAAIARTDANPNTMRRKRGDARHLLSGVLRCGLCSGRMFANISGPRGYTYWCKASDYVDDDGKRWGVGHNCVALKSSDKLVRAVMAAWLAKPETVAAVNAQATEAAAPALHEAAALQARLDDAVASFTAGELSARMLSAIEAELAPKVAAAERLARAQVSTPTLADALADGFDGLDLARQRAVLDAAVTIRVKRAGRRSGKLDPARFVFDWRF